MPSANITALTNAAAFAPDALFYMALSPFGVTDDRKITGSTLFTTISPLNANTQALIVTAPAVPTVPTIAFNHTGDNNRIQFDPSNAGNITDTFDMISVYSEDAQPASYGAWSAHASSAAQWYLYAGAAGTIHMRGRCNSAGAGNTNFLDVPSSGLIFTSNAASGGLILNTDLAAPIIFATGGHAFTDEKGRFDAAGFTLGHVSTITGALNLANAASAFLTTIQAGNAVAARTYVWPTNFGSAGGVLTDAAGNGVLSWATGGGSGTVNTGAQYEIAFYPANGTTVDGSAIKTDATSHLYVFPTDDTANSFQVKNSNGTVNRISMGYYPFGNYSGLWVGPFASPGGTNATLASDGDALIVNVSNTSGGILFRANNGSSPNIATFNGGSGAPTVDIGGGGGQAETLRINNTTSGAVTLLVNMSASAVGVKFNNAGADRYTFSAINPSTIQTLTAPNGATTAMGLIDENVAVDTGGPTTDTTIDLPANSIILGVTVRIRTNITGVDSTTLQVGDPTTATRFNSTASALTAGTTIVGLNQMQGGIVTDATGPVQIATAKVRLTLAGGIDNTPTGGEVRVTIHYIKLTAATA